MKHTLGFLPFKFGFSFNYFNLHRTLCQNLSKKILGFQIFLHDFYQTIFRWTKYCFANPSPWRVMNSLYSKEKLHGNNPAYKNTTCYFNNSYSRCLIKPAIKLSKCYRDKINYGTWSTTSPNKNKERIDNPFLKMPDASTPKINNI